MLIEPPERPEGCDEVVAADFDGFDHEFRRSLRLGRAELAVRGLVDERDLDLAVGSEVGALDAGRR